MEKLITSKSEPCPYGPLYLEAHPGEDVEKAVVDKSGRVSEKPRTLSSKTSISRNAMPIISRELVPID